MNKFYEKYKVYLLYSILWLLITSIILLVFWFNGKSFLLLNDGVYQHYNSFYYLCNAVEQWLTNNGSFDFYSFYLGQGSDIITTLNSYGFLDPVSILTSAMSFLSLVNRYTLMIFIKLWLIGYSFVFYIRTIKKDGNIAVTVSGALIYAFAIVNLYSFARHPNYINWAYFFPLMLGCVELYKRNKLRLPLIIVVCLNVVTSYYTFYMNAILCVIYVVTCSVVKSINRKSLNILREEIISDFKIMTYCLLGVGLSMAALLPTMSAYLNNARIATDTGYSGSLLHYPLDYYLKLFELPFASYTNYGYYTHLGISPLLFLTTIFLFSKKGNYTLKSLIVICVIMICVPVFGKIMNGFGYVCNRWSYALVFFLTTAFVVNVGNINLLSASEKKIYFSVSVIYVGLCFLHSGANKNLQKIISLSLVLLCTFVLLWQSKSKYYLKTVLALTVLCASVNAYCVFSAKFVGYVNSFCDADKIDEAMLNSGSVISDDNGFYRVETSEKKTNVSINNNIHSTGIWYSLLPGSMTDYYYSLGLADYIQNCNFTGLDGRSALLNLADVRYYTKPINSGSFIPYGFEYDSSQSNEQFETYRNIYNTSIGYTYDYTVSESMLDGLNSIQKEMLMLQSAVVDKGSDDVEIKTDLNQIEYSVKDYSDIAYKDGILDVKKDSYIVMEADLSNEYETYLQLSGIELLGDEEELYIYLKVENREGTFTKYSTVTNYNYRWPAIKDELAFYLGSNIDGECTITVSFGGDGSLRLNNLSLLSYDSRDYLEELSKDAVDNIVVEDDMITCHIDIDMPKYLQFSVPYSKGWKAYVDGKETELIKSDYMYMGLWIEEGYHEIELRYEMPYFKDGLVASAACLVVTCLTGYRDYRTKKEEEYEME